MPRPRYSLAALFLIVTALCCWLGYSVKWIKDRRAFRNRDDVMTTITFQDTDPGDEPQTAPGLLWLFGEIGESIVVTQTEPAKAKALFPEAKVYYWPNSASELKLYSTDD